MPILCSRAKGGKFAIWEKPASGDPMAPFDDPASHMDLIRFHSDFQYLSNSIVSNGISVNHTSLAGSTGTGYSLTAGAGSSGSSQAISDGLTRNMDIELYNHSLGYPPLFYVLVDGQIVGPGTAVQSPDNQMRMVSTWADSTKIYLQEFAISSTAALPAITVSYDLVIFRDPAADPALPVMHVKPSAGTVIFGRGKVQASQQTLRRIRVGDTPLYLPRGRTLDIHGGAVRSFSPLGGAKDIGSYTGGFFEIDAIEVTY